MTDGNPNSLTPKAGCEECKSLRDRVDSARKVKSNLTNGIGTGYRREKSRSRQYKHVRDQMNSDENAERLARAMLRMHQITGPEGITDSNMFEFRDCMTIEIRGGRNRA